ncbi:MAG: hypothetical protein K0S54_1040 [Alphaproteobacteria bacterium]|nr:hypothetical protein [Alphaproteobacteria bacterium]
MQPELTDSAFVRLGIVSVDPLIVLGTLDFSNDGRNFTHLRVRTALGDRPAYLLAVLPWTHQAPFHVRRVTELLQDQARQFPHQHFCLLCNTREEMELFRQAGIRTALFNHNIFIDHALFRPLTQAQPRYDAIYNAAMDRFKRHHLMAALRSGVLVYAYWGEKSANAGYYAELRQLLPQCLFANQPDEDRPYEYLPAARVVEFYNQARVGLCLSAAEGAMRASMEYLLCGLPVVTTPNVGGRDLFFDPAYAITAEPEPQAIARAVEELIARQLPPQQVRDAVLRKVRPMRQDFIALLREIYARESRPWPPAGYFRNPFRHPYENVIGILDFPDQLAAAEKAHDTALAID